MTCIKRIVSWNVNGIRAVVKKEGSLSEIFKNLKADIICLQETKITEGDIDDSLRHVAGYESFWSFSQLRKGYSGVATFCRTGFTMDASAGIGVTEMDQEGRIMMTDHHSFVLFNVYFPNGASAIRSEFKMNFYKKFEKHVTELKKTRRVIVVGDVNTAHLDIDIHRKSIIENCSPTYQSERDWITGFIKSGFTDTFRFFNAQTPHNYTWWDPKHFMRNSNKGWRIDYIFVTKEFITDKSRALVKVIEKSEETLEDSSASEENVATITATTTSDAHDSIDDSYLAVDKHLSQDAIPINDHPTDASPAIEPDQSIANIPQPNIEQGESKDEQTSVEASPIPLESSADGSAPMTTVTESEKEESESPYLEAATIHLYQHGSDHCPISIDLGNPVQLKRIPEHPYCSLSSERFRQERKKRTLFAFFKSKPTGEPPAKRQKTEN